MQKVSAKYTEMLAEESATYDIKATVGGVDYLADQLVSVTTQGNIFADDVLGIGGTTARTVDLTLRNPAANIPKMAQIQLYVRRKYGEYSWNVSNVRPYLGNNGTTNIIGVYTAGKKTFYVYYSDSVVYKDGKYSLVNPELFQVSYPVAGWQESEVNKKLNQLYHKWWVPGRTRPENAKKDNLDVTDLCYTTGSGRAIWSPPSLTVYALKGLRNIGGTTRYTITSSVDEELPDNGIYNDLWYTKTSEPTFSEWLPKGVFYIDTRKTDPESGNLTLTGYDAMLKGEQPFAKEGDQGEWPMKDIDVVTEICSRIGVSIDSRTRALLTKGFEVQYPGYGEGAYTVREVLGYIGAMYAGNWTISDSGALRLVQLGA